MKFRTFEGPYFVQCPPVRSVCATNQYSNMPNELFYMLHLLIITGRVRKCFQLAHTSHDMKTFVQNPTYHFTGIAWMWEISCLWKDAGQVLSNTVLFYTDHFKYQKEIGHQMIYKTCYEKSDVRSICGSCEWWRTWGGRNRVDSEDITDGWLIYREAGTLLIFGIRTW